jgi:hypothetical protein
MVSPMQRRHHDLLTRRRTGRALVECCLALVFVASGGALLLLAAATSARVADDALMREQVLQGESLLLAPVLRAPCRQSPHTITVQYGPRVVQRFTAPTGPGGMAQVQSTWRGAALGLASPRSRTAAVAPWCE